jgi:hypothetical protein
MSAPRGILNFNPGNLTDNGIDWEGLAPERSDAALYPGRTSSCRFKHPFYGIRAMVIDIMGDVHGGLNTPAKLMSSYAPAGDEQNDPLAYAQYVAKRLGIKIEDRITTDHACELSKAITRFENGVEGPEYWGSEVYLVATNVALAHLRSQGRA